MRHVNQTRDGIIQALTPAPRKSFRVNYYVEDENGDDVLYSSLIAARDAKTALKLAYERGDEDFGKGKFDCNLVFGG